MGSLNLLKRLFWLPLQAYFCFRHVHPGTGIYTYSCNMNNSIAIKYSLWMLLGEKTGSWKHPRQTSSFIHHSLEGENPSRHCQTSEWRCPRAILYSVPNNAGRTYVLSNTTTIKFIQYVLFVFQRQNYRMHCALSWMGFHRHRVRWHNERVWLGPSRLREK